jgi:hypothetical protein
VCGLGMGWDACDYACTCSNSSTVRGSSARLTNHRQLLTHSCCWVYRPRWPIKQGKSNTYLQLKPQYTTNMKRAGGWRRREEKSCRNKRMLGRAALTE